MAMRKMIGKVRGKKSSSQNGPKLRPCICTALALLDQSCNTEGMPLSTANQTGKRLFTTLFMRSLLFWS